MRDDSGFTIVEALTAMAILAVALVGLYDAGADALNASNHVAKVDRAMLFAQSKLEELALIRTPLPAHDEGEIAESGFQWKLAAEEVPGSRLALETQVLQSVTLEVNWRDGLNQQSLSVEARHLGVANR